ncbi:hypothetical protein [Desulfuromonas thiophila]|uniref:hypothetical protein n=1 Tax=Desulfuromonas thiophila TaxID=57664 RepID=UPI0024A82C44|nr:hypothetical protein [Desulfuromonas thiophila]
MKNRSLPLFPLFALLCLLLCGSLAQAMDIGLLAPSDQRFRAELYYEDYQRDTRQDYPSVYPASSYVGKQEEKRLIARLSLAPQRRWGLSLELGGTDSEHSEQIAPLLGAGAHLVVLERGNLYASLFGRLTYVSGIEYKESYGGYVDELNYGYGTWQRDEDYIEYGGGLQLGTRWQPCAWAELSGYGGLLLSWVEETRSKERERATGKFQGQDFDWSYSDSTIDMREEHQAQLFAGIELRALPSNLALRLESRFYDRTSLSAALLWAF